MPDTPLDDWITLPIRIGTVEQVHAYGVITLTYNRLEELMVFLIDLYFPNTELEYEPSPGVLCAEMLTNRKRIDFLKVLLEAQEEDEEVKSRVYDAISIFEVCSENRNILAHGQSDSATYDPDIFTIRKMASGGLRREILFEMTLDDLRDTANSMAKSMDYVWQLNMFLVAHRICPTAFYQEYGDGFFPALPEKPQKPCKLSPRRPSADRTSAQPQPRPSRPLPQPEE